MGFVFVLLVCVFSLQNGYAPVEFFLEGTRSRSAKTLTPKFGRFLTDWGKTQAQRLQAWCHRSCWIELDTCFARCSLLHKCNCFFKFNCLYLWAWYIMYTFSIFLRPCLLSFSVCLNNHFSVRLQVFWILWWNRFLKEKFLIPTLFQSASVTIGYWKKLCMLMSS